MKSYTITYWPPGGTTGNVQVEADEFVFSESHVLFLNPSHQPIYVMPLSLQPIIRYTGDASDG